MFNLCVERQGFALNWMCELCGVPLSSILRHAALLSTLVFFPLLLLAQVNLHNALPEIWKSQNDSLKLRQKHLHLVFCVCGSLIQHVYFLINNIETFSIVLNSLNHWISDSTDPQVIREIVLFFSEVMQWPCGN